MNLAGLGHQKSEAEIFGEAKRVRLSGEAGEGWALMWRIIKGVLAMHCTWYCAILACFPVLVIHSPNVVVIFVTAIELSHAQGFAPSTNEVNVCIMKVSG
jgi:hypothetical protein